MKLIPYALRPSTLLRRQAMKRGLRSDSELVQLISFLAVSRPAVIRRTATRRGLLGTSRLWRVVGYWFVAGDVYRKLAVKEPDRLGTERLSEGQTVTVVTMHRPTRRERRRAAS